MLYLYSKEVILKDNLLELARVSNYDNIHLDYSLLHGSCL